MLQIHSNCNSYIQTHNLLVLGWILILNIEFKASRTSFSHNLNQLWANIIPWKSRVLARAQFEFAQWVTLGTSNILTPRFPWPRTLTNHIGVSDIGGPKALLFYRPDTARVLSIGQLRWSGYVTPCILLIGHSIILLRAVISKCILGAAPRVGPFSLLVARPYSFLDVGLDFCRIYKCSWWVFIYWFWRFQYEAWCLWLYNGYGTCYTLNNMELEDIWS